jgi:acyl-ACP thioesterase
MDDPTATVDYRVRFDEAGPAGSAKPSLYLRLAQDAAWIHSERLGFTRAWYEERGLAWLVRGVALEVRGGAGHGDVVTVTTRVLGYRRIWARRRADVLVGSRPVATALTDWILTDRRGRPVRIPDAIPQRLPGSERSLEALRVPGTPDRPADIVIEAAVRHSEADPLAHVNNAAYLDRVLDLGASVDGSRGFRPDRLDRPTVALEYRAAVAPGDVVRESAWILDGGMAFAYRMSIAEEGATILRAQVSVPDPAPGD